MFYKMITNKRDEWLKTDNPVKELIAYIEKTNQMRDAQVDAIKTYLYLKIACDNKPLAKLFSEGCFNSIDIDELEISTATREALKHTPSLAALYEYASQKDESGNLVSDKICSTIRSNSTAIDSPAFFKSAFYNVGYTDYLFSLPMGAGKTYLMAAFIYLDLYFALNEPENKAFAHNFIIFAPSGLKSSVVPSLRTIQNFNPSWIIPEPAASKLKQMLIFEVLDENKTAKKSNKTRNPNVQKIAIHQPLEELMGLVAVTNAEKVILDRVEEKNGQITMFEDSDDVKDRQANELRNYIGKIPNLSIFIDEVHHAATEEKKLRAVVRKWTQTGNINNVVGFSGTPYLQKADKIKVTGTLSVATQEISNIVYYYPLVDGIGNFLKKPTVYISDSNQRLEIVENGVREFLKQYKDVTYSDGTCAKLGIYCGTIKALEEQVYPLVEKLVGEYGLTPSVAILKYHGGNKEYAIPVNSELEFGALDKPFSKKKIILLVQIGKEGWDCRSLTGIILSQEGDCATNMVLQTSCRCLRQVQKDTPETALIYLNKSNADVLNLQLQQQHRISLQQFQNGADSSVVTIRRYDRTSYLKLPKVDFYQLKVIYKTAIEEAATDIASSICNAPNLAKRQSLIQTAELSTTLAIEDGDIDKAERGDSIANFYIWLNQIIKESFGFLSREQLYSYQSELQTVFETITYEKDGIRYFSSHYSIEEVNAHIRKAFYDKRSFETSEELIPAEASLLRIENFTQEVQTTHPNHFFPNAVAVENMIKEDSGKPVLDKTTQKMLELAEAMGNEDIVRILKAKSASPIGRNYSYHYAPYHTDSTFEQEYLDELVKLSCVKELGLEVYYNGDRALTEFKIKCYKLVGKAWRYIGLYTPDFLVVKRKDGKIYKAIIVETKGQGYAENQAFKDRREFVQTVFTAENNKAYGYPRFDYLYIEDSMESAERIKTSIAAIEKFFKEEV